MSLDRHLKKKILISDAGRGLPPRKSYKRSWKEILSGDGTRSHACHKHTRGTQWARSIEKSRFDRASIYPCTRACTPFPTESYTGSKMHPDCGKALELVPPSRVGCPPAGGGRVRVGISAEPALTDGLHRGRRPTVDDKIAWLRAIK